MLKKDVKLGSTYAAKIGDNLTVVRLDSESQHGGWDATNLTTGRSVRIKSAAKLRGEAEAPEQVEPEATDEEIAIADGGIIAGLLAEEAEVEEAPEASSDSDDEQAEEGEAKPPKAKHGRLSGFNSHGKRFRQITLPRAVHEALVETHPEGTLYDVQVEDDGRIVATPVAAE